MGKIFGSFLLLSIISYSLSFSPNTDYLAKGNTTSKTFLSYTDTLSFRR